MSSQRLLRGGGVRGDSILKKILKQSQREYEEQHGQIQFEFDATPSSSSLSVKQEIIESQEAEPVSMVTGKKRKFDSNAILLSEEGVRSEQTNLFVKQEENDNELEKNDDDINYDSDLVHEMFEQFASNFCCIECGQKNKNQSLLDDHIKNRHELIVEVNVPKLSLTSAELAVLKSQGRTEADCDPLAGGQQQRVFTAQRQSPNSPLVCQHCDNQFTFARRCQAHLEEHAQAAVDALARQLHDNIFVDGLPYFVEMAYDYRARAPDELDCQKGDHLIVVALPSTDSGWCLCETTAAGPSRRTGLVPLNRTASWTPRCPVCSEPVQSPLPTVASQCAICDDFMHQGCDAPDNRCPACNLLFDLEYTHQWDLDENEQSIEEPFPQSSTSSSASAAAAAAAAATTTTTSSSLSTTVDTTNEPVSSTTVISAEQIEAHLKTLLSEPDRIALKCTNCEITCNTVGALDYHYHTRHSEVWHCLFAPACKFRSKLEVRGRAHYLKRHGYQQGVPFQPVTLSSNISTESQQQTDQQQQTEQQEQVPVNEYGVPEKLWKKWIVCLPSIVLSYLTVVRNSPSAQFRSSVMAVLHVDTDVELKSKLIDVYTRSFYLTNSPAAVPFSESGLAALRRLVLRKCDRVRHINRNNNRNNRNNNRNNNNNNNEDNDGDDGDDDDDDDDDTDDLEAMHSGGNLLDQEEKEWLLALGEDDMLFD